MRVLTFSWEYPPVIEGGLARHVGELSRQLVAQGVEVHVVTRAAAGPVGTGTGRIAPSDGAVVHRATWTGGDRVPRKMDAFLEWVARMNAAMAELAAELIESIDIDLVHSHDWLVADAARRTARRAGRPWLVTVHATEHGRHGGWISKHPQSVIHACERAMVRDADHVITCSRFMSRHLTAVFGVAARQITVLPNGVAAAPEPVTADPGGDLPGDLSGLRRRFAAPDQRLVALVGRLVHEKGFHLALEALASVTRERGDVRFVVAGAGPAEAQLRRQARRLGLDGSGRFLGWVGDEMLRTLYRVADLCVVPSIYEPFGIVALEAMAGDCPCVVADTGGLSEVVPDDGRVGLRFPAGDAVALAEVIGRALGDDALRARLTAQARTHVLAFDWSAVARATGEIYARLGRDWPRVQTSRANAGHVSR